MKEDNVKIWVDVSHIAGWKGGLSGIERTEYHLIKHYFSDDQAGFINWNNQTASFEIASREFVKKAVIDRTSEKEHSSESSSNSVARRLRNKIARSKKKGQSAIPDGNMLVLSGLWDNEAYIEGLKHLAQNHDLIHIVYDMIPLLHPEYMVDYLPGVFGKYMLEVLPRCKKIMAISEATKADTIKILNDNNLPVPEVAAFRLGDDLARSAKAIRPQSVPKEGYILAVSTIEARKNHQLLYYAAKLAEEQNIKLPPIVIAGRRGWLTGDFQYLVAHDPSKSIVILENTTDSQLRWLYENCLFTVFPSFYEGWGLPVAESLSYGKVTLASKTSSIPEVGGQSADYFSPFEAGQLIKLAVKYLDAKARTSKEKEIKDNYKQLSWDIAAAKFAELAER